MARIQLSDGFLVRSDANGWIAARIQTFKTGKRAGEKYETVIGFYPSLSAALSGLCEAKIRGSDADSLQAVKTLINDFREEVTMQLSTKVEANDDA